MGNVTFNFKPYKMVDVRLRAATDLQVSEGWSFTNLNTPFDTDGEYMRWKRDWRNTNYEALVMFHNGCRTIFSMSTPASVRRPSRYMAHACIPRLLSSSSRTCARFPMPKAS